MKIDLPADVLSFVVRNNHGDTLLATLSLIQEIAVVDGDLTIELMELANCACSREEVLFLMVPTRGTVQEVSEVSDRLRRARTQKILDRRDIITVNFDIHDDASET